MAADETDLTKFLIFSPKTEVAVYMFISRSFNEKEYYNESTETPKKQQRFIIVQLKRRENVLVD